MKTNWNEPENWHYAASVFPLLPKDELDALATDIAKHGLLNCVIRCGGKILDGRNRILACLQVNIEPKFIDIAPSEARAWAMSQNLYRRHMQPTEQALMVHLLELKGGEPCDVKGLERVRAYKKLALLKDEVAQLADALPETYAVQLRALLKQKHVKGNEHAHPFWKLVVDKLNALLPSGSDGVEHIMVTLLDRMHTEEWSPDPHVRQAIAAMLREIAGMYTEHATRLESRKP